MMILTVIVVAIFRTTTVLGNAYGETTYFNNMYKLKQKPCRLK